MRRLLALLLAMATLLGPAFSQKKDTYKVRTLVIDPGHGGAKPGAIGSRSQEKDIVLSVALKFGQLVRDNYPDVKVIYTRTTDEDISLAERAHIANRNKADLFISIHANSHPTTSPTGVETFVMGLSESKANLEVARKENADILLEADYKSNSDYQGFDPSAPETYVMLAMFQSAFLDKSLNFAQYIQNQYRKNLKTINRGVKQAELYVLYKTSMPSVLTEIGFISNPAEESYMLSDEGQAQIAVCLFYAFMNYRTAEEGIPPIENPVIKLKGYMGAATPRTTTTQPTRQSVQQPVTAQPDTVAQTVVEATPETTPETTPEATPEPRPSNAAATTTTPVTRPVPSVEMPQRVEPERPAQEPAAVRPEQPAQPQPRAQHQTGKRNSNGLELPGYTATSEIRFYTVQFLLTDQAVKAGDEKLGGIDEYDVFRKKNGLAYCCGRFATLQEASNYCNRLKAVTIFKDAWVFLCEVGENEQFVTAARVDGRNAAPATATPATSVNPKPEARPATAVTENNGAIIYRVQFMSTPRNIKPGDPDLGGITDVKVEKIGNVYAYLAGSYSSRSEAEQRCADIKTRTAFKDAFVVAFRNGERIKLK